MRNLRRQGVLALGLAGLLAGTAACGGGDSGDDDNGTAGGKTGGTMVFGTSADPISMDGAYVSDGESLRVVRQLFETLVTTEPGGTEIVPGLAKEWESDEAGTTWTFTLQDGVTFHDGTEFNAEAVCANFDRWYNFKGVQQSASVSYYWQTVFSGYAKNEDPALGTSLYKSCEAQDGKAVINLTSPSASFLSGLALASFSIASPEALTKYEADKVTGTGEEPRFEGTFGTKNPVGTGPFKLETYEPNNRLVLARFDDYWGDKAKLDKVIFKPIADGPARRQALEAGEIQGYDLVDPADLGALEGAGFQIQERPAFNVGYVGFNTAKAPFDNLKIRQAIAHALNRQALVTAKYPPGAEVAKEFMPPSLFGYADDVPEYDYDVEKAKQLIKESGVANPTLEFWYPTGVSRPYMPDPVAQLPGLLGRPDGRRLQGRPEVRPVEPGLPQRGRHRRHAACACSAGRVTSVTRTTSSGPSSGPSRPRGAPWSRASTATSRRLARSRTRASAPLPTRPPTRRSWSSCRVCRTSTPSRRSPSPRASRATCRAR